MFTSLFFCAASLFSCVGLTLAWFARNRNVTGSGIGVGAERKNDLLGYEFYTADAEAEGYVFTLAEDKNAASLGEYDLLDDRYRLLLKLYLKDGEGNVTVTTTTGTDYFAGDGEEAHKLVKTLPSAEEVKANGVKNPLSSVVAMRMAAASEFSFSANAYTWTKPTETENYVTMVSAERTIVTAEICNSYAVADLPTDTYRGETCRALYILFSYDADLVSEVFSANIGNEAIGNAENAPVPFASDFNIFLSIA